MVLPLQNKPEFKPEVEKYGLSMGQMCFDTIRDIGTALGIMNWYVSGVGLEKRQHVYLTCEIRKEIQSSGTKIQVLKAGYLQCLLKLKEINSEIAYGKLI